MNKIDDLKMSEKEEKDYQTAKRIFSKLFKNYNIQFQQMPIGSVSDMRFSFIMKNGDVAKYNVEIKSRNQCLEDYDTLPLTVQKYANLKDNTEEWEKLIYISLVNDEEYYIFDLKNIDWNKVDCRNWLINDIEYSEQPTKKKIPTFFIPIAQSCYNGFIN